MSQANTSIDSIAWLTGSWQGSLGPMTVEETWYPPKHGSMQMMIRLSNPDTLQMLEFIVVREVTDQSGGNSLALDLRQFSPAMELVTDQSMTLLSQSDRSIAFTMDGEASVKKLEYTLTETNQLKVDVTVATGDVVTALLER